MNFIDTNAWIGSWPFSPVSLSESRSPKIRRVGYKISEALISSFDAVFQTDPMPGNRAILDVVKKSRTCRPLPIINPATPAWVDHLEEVSQHAGVVAVRLLPGYHGYSLRSAATRTLLEHLKEKKLRLVITARLVDERQEHHALSIKPVAVSQLTQFVERHPKINPLIQGLGVHELKELAKSDGLFSTDTSFAEWEDTLRVVKQNIPISRIQFGSLSPLQIAQAQIDKVRLSSLSIRQREAVALNNAQKFFKI